MNRTTFFRRTLAAFATLPFISVVTGKGDEDQTIEGRVGKLAVKRGEVLVIELPASVSMLQREKLTRRVLDILHVPLLVVPAGTRIGVIAKEEEPQEAPFELGRETQNA